MKYLKYFEQASAYEAYKNGSDYVLPNVSYVEETKGVSYEPYVEIKETRVVCTYNVTKTASATKVCNDTSGFISMEVDGVLQDNATTKYTFDTVGEHTIKFELANPTSIGEYVFMSCSGLTSINIPDSVTTIESSAFSHSSGLTSINIPDSVTTIESSAFGYCSGLTDVHIGSGVTTIEKNVFVGCSNLTSIVVSERNTVYDSRENCNCIIETATNTLIKGCNNSFIPDSVTTIGYDAFSYCSGLTSVNIPDSVTTIESYAFSYCSGLTSINIPDLVTSIGNNAFAYCKSLTEVHIGSGVTEIGEHAFYYCSGLTSINILDSVTTIGNNAFESCSGLTSITCNAITAPTISNDTFRHIKQGGVLKVPTGSDYSTWMSTDDYYLGKYNWTIEYI